MTQHEEDTVIRTVLEIINENLMVDLGCILYVFTIIIYFDTALVINNLTCFMDG